jgi:hypothetical protein
MKTEGIRIEIEPNTRVRIEFVKSMRGEEEMGFVRSVDPVWVNARIALGGFWRWFGGLGSQAESEGQSGQRGAFDEGTAEHSSFHQYEEISLTSLRITSGTGLAFDATFSGARTFTG